MFATCKNPYFQLPNIEIQIERRKGKDMCPKAHHSRLLEKQALILAGRALAVQETFGIQRASTTGELTLVSLWQQKWLVDGSEFRPKTRRLEGGVSFPLVLFCAKNSLRDQSPRSFFR